MVDVSKDPIPSRKNELTIEEKKKKRRIVNKR
jgi:hypothetical protein